MEIKLIDVAKDTIKNLNLVFEQNQVTTLIGPNNSGINEILNLICVEKKIDNGIIKIGRKKIDSTIKNKKIIEIQKDIFCIKEECKNLLFNINILEDIKYYAKKINEEKLYELLKSFNLDYSICKKNYLELSDSEIKKIILIIGLLIDTKILIINNPTNNLDNKAIQTLIKQLKKIKRENKIIIISSYNTDFLLQVADKVFVIKNNKVIDQGNKFDIFTNEKLLKEINLSVPNVIKFENMVKELKNIKIGYRDNINDLLKDIFRHAK